MDAVCSQVVRQTRLLVKAQQASPDGVAGLARRLYGDSLYCLSSTFAASVPYLHRLFYMLFELHPESQPKSQQWHHNVAEAKASKQQSKAKLVRLVQAWRSSQRARGLTQRLPAAVDLVHRALAV